MDAAGVTVEVDRGDTDATAGVERKFYASPEALYMREYEWVQPVRWVAAYGWGRPLSCLDSPRRRAWDHVAAIST